MAVGVGPPVARPARRHPDLAPARIVSPLAVRIECQAEIDRDLRLRRARAPDDDERQPDQQCRKRNAQHQASTDAAGVVGAKAAVEAGKQETEAAQKQDDQDDEYVPERHDLSSLLAPKRHSNREEMCKIMAA